MDKYFEELIKIVDCQEHPVRLYKELLWYLYSTEFYWVVELDANRAADGLDLRRSLCDDFSIDYFDTPCSVLEMMIALAIRCENDIMYDEELGNRVPKWFWLMIKNLKLDKMDDFSFEIGPVSSTISGLMGRKFGPNGEGSLFPLPKNGQMDHLWTTNGPDFWSKSGPLEDEIWVQMSHFLTQTYDFLA